MIILIAGGTHTGKTALAQRLLEKYHFPYLSIDHLKMGLIRSGHTSLTPISSDDDLTAYLWPVVREMVKTCIENRQNLIVEGCYLPFNYADDFTEKYLKEIRYICLVFSREYIENHFEDIKQAANAVESRIDDGHLSKGLLLRENENNLILCKQYKRQYILIDNTYDADFDI